MKEAIEAAIKLLAGRIDKDTKPGDAMQLSQAALNLAHAQATYENMKK